ncbi:MAG: hypothetical protein ONB05_02985 [candidate division KSB1 bacterium]|nr:hypothetical protein [candidate division KSB1 bacterium]
MMMENVTETDEYVKARDFVPQADMISLETVVNMLVKKRLCTVDELFDEERKIREKNLEQRYSPVVNIQERSHHSRHSWLKRIMSKRRWTRRLGTFLFGWKWKKVKRTHEMEGVLNSFRE